MKFGANAYFNEDSSFIRGYAEGDRLTPSTMVMFPDAETPERAAETVFTWMNDDRRPNGRTERSLSVGDVVKIIDPERGDFWFTVEGVGWRSIDNPLRTEAT